VDVRHDVTQLRGRERHAGVPLDLSHVLPGHVGEGVVGRCGAVWVEPKDYACQVRVVGCRTAELIIRVPRPERAAGEVLQLTPPTLVADLEIKLAVRTKENLPAIVIAAHGLVGVGLERMQHNDVPVER
jgi:hypothetical protein